MSSISYLHTTNIILADNYKFWFVGSILEATFRDIPAASKILEAYMKLPVSGFCSLMPDMQLIIDEADKLKKGGQKGARKGKRNKMLERVRPRNERHKLTHRPQFPLQQRNES